MNSRSFAVIHFPLTYEYVFTTQQNDDCLSKYSLAALNNLVTFVIILFLTRIIIWKTADSGRDRHEQLNALTFST
jgi:hypothetical protein